MKPNKLSEHWWWLGVVFLGCLLNFFIGCSVAERRKLVYDTTLSAMVHALQSLQIPPPVTVSQDQTEVLVATIAGVLAVIGHRYWFHKK